MLNKHGFCPPPPLLRGGTNFFPNCYLRGESRISHGMRGDLCFRGDWVSSSTFPRGTSFSQQYVLLDCGLNPLIKYEILRGLVTYQELRAVQSFSSLNSLGLKGKDRFINGWMDVWLCDYVFAHGWLESFFEHWIKIFVVPVYWLGKSIHECLIIIILLLSFHICIKSEISIFDCIQVVLIENQNSFQLPRVHLSGSQGIFIAGRDGTI